MSRGFAKFREHAMGKIRNLYESKGLKYGKLDHFTWTLIVVLVPQLAFLMFTFWMLKLLFINVLLTNYGFERAVIYMFIMASVKPLVKDIFGLGSNGKERD